MPKTEKQILDITDQLKGQVIKEVIYYLEPEYVDLKETRSKIGDTLYDGVDLVTNSGIYSIGNRFKINEGLDIKIGSTKNIELLNSDKKPISVSFESENNEILEASLYWQKSFWENNENWYPQDLVVKTVKGLLVFSSLEIMDDKPYISPSDELFVTSDMETITEFELGDFGKGKLFKSAEEIKNEL